MRCPNAQSLAARRGSTLAGEAPTRKCARCGQRFELAERRGRNSGRCPPKETDKRVYHKGARYCSETCRKLASKARRAALQQPSPGAVKNGSKPHRGPDVLSTVTRVENSCATSIPWEGENQGRGSLKKPALDRRIVPDAKWPGMYRIRLPGGSLTDMVNLTRARDVLGGREP
jgi:hypothetical protein